MPSASPHRVLVTRARQQGSQLAEELRQRGLQPVLLPAIETVPPGSYAALDAALGELATFDWLLVTSANAVDAMAGRLPLAGLPPGLQVAAIGPATAARVGERLGCAVALVPPMAVAESLAEALLPYARREDGAPARFLLVRAEQAREHLPKTLRAAGAEVTVAAAYRTVIPSGSEAMLRAVLADLAGAPAAATFTSASTARNLLALCQAAGVVLPAGVRRVSIGPVTSAAMRELGWAPDAESPEATVAALAETVRLLLD